MWEKESREIREKRSSSASGDLRRSTDDEWSKTGNKTRKTRGRPLFRFWDEGHITKSAEEEHSTMADSSVTVPKFSGRQAEDSEDFVRDFKAYVVYRQLRPSQAYNLLGIVLKDKAKDYYIKYDESVSEGDYGRRGGEIFDRDGGTLQDAADTMESRSTTS